MRRTLLKGALTATLSVALLSCADAGPEAEQQIAESDTMILTAEEEAAFAVDPLKYPEMQDGRLDTLDMVGSSDDASWHAQVINYGDRHIALTYAAWYVGLEDAVRFAVDGQPRLVDDLGRVYAGQTVAHNPRIEVESGSTAVGVYVFEGPFDQNADSLTLHVNDSTPPVIRIGPFAVGQDAGSGGPRTGTEPSGSAPREAGS